MGIDNFPSVEKNYSKSLARQPVKSWPPRNWLIDRKWRWNMLFLLEFVRRELWLRINIFAKNRIIRFSRREFKFFRKVTQPYTASSVVFLPRVRLFRFVLFSISVSFCFWTSPRNLSLWHKSRWNWCRYRSVINVCPVSGDPFFMLEIQSRTRAVTPINPQICK